MLYSKLRTFPVGWARRGFGYIHVNIDFTLSNASSHILSMIYRIASEMTKTVQGNLQGPGDAIAISENG